MMYVRRNERPRTSYRAAGALALAAALCLAMAFLRYRATGITGASFEHEIAGGVKDQVTYVNAGPWTLHFQTWLGAAAGLAAAACGLAVAGRRAISHG